jgi:hypothetical protein
VSRRRTSIVRSAQSWGRAEARIRQARGQPAAVSVRYQCPVCGGEHTRLEHAAPGCHGLTDAELQELRRRASDELVNAVRNGAEQDHINSVIAVLDVIDNRLEIR